MRQECVYVLPFCSISFFNLLFSSCCGWYISPSFPCISFSALQSPVEFCGITAWSYTAFATPARLIFLHNRGKLCGIATIFGRAESKKLDEPKEHGRKVGNFAAIHAELSSRRDCFMTFEHPDTIMAKRFQLFMVRGSMQHEAWLHSDGLRDQRDVCAMFPHKSAQKAQMLQTAARRSRRTRAVSALTPASETPCVKFNNGKHGRQPCHEKGKGHSSEQQSAEI